MLAELFPRLADANAINAQADELAQSRLWAGIHYHSDIVSGLALGRAVGGAVINRANTDGAGQMPAFAPEECESPK